MCDLVLLSWNHLEQTQPCLETLFASTRVPSRLFIVDNGSEPAVRAFLAAVRPQGAIQEVTLLQQETNEGFPRGMNRGIRASTAPYVCLLNNDLRFTNGWLTEMIAVMQAYPEIGVLNPESNNFGGGPSAGMSNEYYAQQLHVRRGQYTEVGMCIGFCLLTSRVVLDRIGPLNEAVDKIFFEDEDFCMRAVEAGYRCAVATGAYVEHVEHQTVANMPEREALFARNRQWCEDKWGKRLRMAWPMFAPLTPGSLELRERLTELLMWVRRRIYIYVYAPLPRGMTKETLFRSVDLVPHADIQWHVVPQACAPLATTVLILKRQKKRFNLIAAPAARAWIQMMRWCRWIHRATVVAQADAQQVQRQWQQQSRSPSSF